MIKALIKVAFLHSFSMVVLLLQVNFITVYIFRSRENSREALHHIFIFFSLQSYLNQILHNSM